MVFRPRHLMSPNQAFPIPINGFQGNRKWCFKWGGTAVIANGKHSETIIHSPSQDDLQKPLPIKLSIPAHLRSSPRFFLSILIGNRQRFLYLAFPFCESQEQHFLSHPRHLSSLSFHKIMDFPVTCTFTSREKDPHEYPGH